MQKNRDRFFYVLQKKNILSISSEFYKIFSTLLHISLIKIQFECNNSINKYTPIHGLFNPNLNTDEYY